MYLIGLYYPIIINSRYILIKQCWRAHLLRRSIVITKQKFKSSEETRVDVDVHFRKSITDTIFSFNPNRPNRPIEVDAGKFQTLNIDDAQWEYIHDESSFHVIP